MTYALQAAVHSTSQVVEYDVHGLVGIRLVDPSPRDVSAISAQIGDLQGVLPHEPDITIRFVREVGPGDALCWIEPHEVGFTEDGFFLFAPGSGAKAAARLALDMVDGSFELVCRSGLGTVPLLRSLVDLRMLAKGVIALHASAFTCNGTGVLVAGWARGGKTTSLLAFASHGADFIGDDRVYLSSEANRLYGLGEPVHLRAWHLAELPRYREVVGRRARLRLGLVSALAGLAGSAGAPDRTGGVRGFANRVASVANDASVAIPPHRLFARCPLTGRLDKAFLAIAHESADVRVEPVAPEYLAERLVFSARAERLGLMARYLAFRFAFPDQPSTLIERADELERRLLLGALAESETFALYHPFPAPVQALHEAMAPLLA
jgi:hypothetical protein